MLTNPTYQYMIDEVDWYYIPMINVDGYIETYTGVKSKKCFQISIIDYFLFIGSFVEKN